MATRPNQNGPGIRNDRWRNNYYRQHEAAHAMSGFPDISVDTILRIVEIASIIGGGGLVAFKLGRSTEKMQASIEAHSVSARRQTEDIADLKNEIKQLGAILTKLALQEQRLDMLDKRYEELRHGDGWVQRGINGEYPK